MSARYLELSRSDLQSRAQQAYEIYRECRVCPHACEVDRTQGQTGYCGQTDVLRVSSSVRHFGEEPPLVGKGGVGNLFVTACNMRCDYCQNFQISQNWEAQNWEEGAGLADVSLSYRNIAEQMIRLQEEGVHFIGWVSPSHVVPGLLKSLSLAREMGLKTPIIYNTNAYDALDTLKLLDGVVDVYLPDLKYSHSATARELSHIKEYPEFSRQAVLEMYRQVGSLSVGEDGLAESGLLVRHLLLPENLAGTWETLCFIALELSPGVPLSLMSQYRPVHKVTSPLNREISPMEYETAIGMARELGFENLYLQSLEATLHNLPDFDNTDNPFPLDRTHNQENIKVK
ncbi:MAG: radical SAM protein [Nitrospinae bacterium]|nr:radical SAM protein [Nitrospinota bacterium]MBL7019425.1 radical SAM protein [Nitrospinaceae bacterium]